MTGLGAVSPWGWGSEALHQGLLSGRSAIDLPQKFDVEGHRTRRMGEVPEAPAELGAAFHQWARWTRAEQFALGAAREAVTMAGLSFHQEKPNPNVGVFFGGSTAGMDEAEHFFRRVMDQEDGRPWIAFLAAHQLNGPGDAVARHLGLGGPVETFSAACASGGLALAAALEALRDGEVDMALAGGADALCQLTCSGFNSLRAVDEDNCLPFRAERRGLNIGEGAGVLVLERLSHARQRNARPLARLLGSGTSCDAHHMTSPHPQGEGAARAIQLALEDAHLSPEDVSFVNAHGTGTPQNDAAEWLALERVFGDRSRQLPVTSNKGAVGHLLGSSGALEAVATVLALDHHTIHPTPGPGPPDPKLGVDLVLREARPLTGPAVAISTSFAFGGANAALALGSPPPEST